MTHKRAPFLLTAFLVALVETAWAQKASHWRVYRMADGLPEPACLSLCLTHPRATSPLATSTARPSRSSTATTSAASPPPDSGRSRIYESPGGQLWAVTRDGLKEFRGGQWKTYPVPALASHFNTNAASVLDPAPLYPVRQGLVIFLLPDQLCELSFEHSGASQTTGLAPRRGHPASAGSAPFLPLATAAYGSPEPAGWRRPPPPEISSLTRPGANTCCPKRWTR